LEFEWVTCWATFIVGLVIVAGSIISWIIASKINSHYENTHSEPPGIWSGFLEIMFVWGPLILIIPGFIIIIDSFPILQIIIGSIGALIFIYLTVYFISRVIILIISGVSIVITKCRNRKAKIEKNKEVKERIYLSKSLKHLGNKALLCARKATLHHLSRSLLETEGIEGINLDSKLSREILDVRFLSFFNGDTVELGNPVEFTIPVIRPECLDFYQIWDDVIHPNIPNSTVFWGAGGTPVAVHVMSEYQIKELENLYEDDSYSHLVLRFCSLSTFTN